MADLTKAELVELKEKLESQNEEQSAKIKALEKQIAETPETDHLQTEIDRLNRLNKDITQEKDDYKVRLENDVREREIIEADRIAAEEAQAAQFKKLKIDQSEHTRFRIYGRPPAGQRDIFGDPTTIVADLGVELQNYFGGLYVPVSIIVEVGQSIGMLTREQATELKKELEDTRAKIESAGTFATELRNGIETLVSTFYADLNSVVSDDSNAEPDNSEDAGTESDSKSDSGVGEATADPGVNRSNGFFSNLQ